MVRAAARVRVCTSLLGQHALYRQARLRNLRGGPLNPFDPLKLHQHLHKSGLDMRKPACPGGYRPPLQGIAPARLVGYFELGIHEINDYDRLGHRKDVALVDFVFELSGKGYEPREGIPQRIAIQEALSLAPDARFLGLFAAMNHRGKAKHMAELLGRPFMVEVFHRKSTDGERIYATLKGSHRTWPAGNGYRISAAPEDDVDMPLTELKAFIWDMADKDMWDSIFIEGEYPEQRDADGKVVRAARSKNVIQEKIASAKSWPELKHRLNIPD